MSTDRQGIREARELVERSSLGSAGARALRARGWPPATPASDHPGDPACWDAFSTPTMLHRQACADAHQAAHRAAEFAATGNAEHQLRERDAVVDTIIHAQAAAESWIYAIYRNAGVEPSPRTGWVQVWLDAPGAICRHPTRRLEPATEHALLELSTWRNYLIHGDHKARRRLHARVPENQVTHRLNAALAREVIDNMDAAFTDASSLLGVHGGPALHSSSLRIAPQEN